MLIRRARLDGQRRAFRVLTALTLLVYMPCRADVPTPPPPPPPPAGSYCANMYNELNGDLQAFNTVLATPPTWTPVPGGPTLYGANLQWANSNTGPSISGPNYMQTVVQPELQELKALGIQAISVPVLYPVLYEPFYGSPAALAPYTAFYTQVAQAVRAAGLKLIIDNEILFSNDIAAGFTNMNTFYGSLTWPEYIVARATTAANIAAAMQPDYLMLANEPDTEALQTGQQNCLIPADYAAMVQAEISAVQALNLPTPPKMGAGFGTWMATSGTASLTNYINAFTALPLDYIDFHLLPINTVQSSNFLTNSLIIASMAAAVGKPVAISQAWVTKETGGEWDVLSSDVIRARGPFTFWDPLDAYFLQTAEALASYTNMIYMVPQFPVFLSAQQTYGGTVGNGGAANCTCTTASCSDYNIMLTENSLASAADNISVYTSTAVSYYNQLVTTPDTTAPTTPPNLIGTAGYTTAALSWGNSTDNIGVAGYNVYRCAPPLLGQPCTGVWIANTTLPLYNDTTLTSGAPYNYQVSAFDFVNNESPLSPALGLQTFITSGSSATNLVATVVSAQEISLSWSAPTNTNGLSSYLIYAGTSPSNLQQIAVRPAGTLTYNNMNLAAGTTYFYGIVAVEQGIHAPMSNNAYGTTLPLPTPPSSVTGAPAPTKVVLTWQENLQPGGKPISFYEVFQGTTPGNLTKVASATGTTYTAASLTPNTTYYFEIVAVDNASPHDYSPPSDQMAVMTLPLPAAPVITSVTANSAARITVAWSETVPAGGLSISSYTIFRGTSPTGLTKLATRGPSPLTFTDTTGITPGTTYYYSMEATDSGQDVSPMSTVAMATTPPLPAAPVITSATATPAKVTINFTETVPPGGLPVTSFKIYRGTSPTSLALLTTRSASPFYDTAVSPNTIYFYALTATDSGGDVSAESTITSVTTPPLPAAPVNVGATANSTSQITVTWSENIPPGGLPVTSYSIYRGTTPTGLTKLTARSTTTYIDTGLTPATTYYYAITATDSGGDVSAMSATANATTP